MLALAADRWGVLLLLLDRAGFLKLSGQTACIDAREYYLPALRAVSGKEAAQ